MPASFVLRRALPAARAASLPALLATLLALLAPALLCGQDGRAFGLRRLPPVEEELPPLVPPGGSFPPSAPGFAPAPQFATPAELPPAAPLALEPSPAEPPPAEFWPAEAPPTPTFLEPTPGARLWATLGGDQRRFYSREHGMQSLLAFGVGAALANTSVDGHLQDWWQDDVRSPLTDDFSRTAKLFGEGKYLLPLAAGAGLVGLLAPEHPLTDPFGEWGLRTSRAYLVGAAPLLVSQVVVGASRPGESPLGSQWRPFADNNGVSGHAFIGAVPFLSAARMTENPWLRSALYAGSTLTALSRINDDAHFTSQAVLGWWLAWLACETIQSDPHAPWGVTSLPGGEGLAVYWDR